jgi:hypothetical protein
LLLGGGFCFHEPLLFSLDSAVGRAQMVQHIGLSGETEKIKVTFFADETFFCFAR